MSDIEQSSNRLQPDFTFGQLFIWIGENIDQIWLPRDLMSDFEPTLTWPDITFGKLFI